MILLIRLKSAFFYRHHSVLEVNTAAHSGFKEMRLFVLSLRLRLFRLNKSLAALALPERIIGYLGLRVKLLLLSMNLLLLFANSDEHLQRHLFLDFFIGVVVVFLDQRLGLLGCPLEEGIA